MIMMYDNICYTVIDWTNLFVRSPLINFVYKIIEYVIHVVGLDIKQEAHHSDIRLYRYYQNVI